MYKKWKSCICICLLLAFFSACTYKKADIAYPQSTSCDTTNVRLSVELNDILTQNCYSCHGGDAAGAAGIQLQNYSVISQFALDGTLLSAITQDGNAVPMPKDAPKLSDCDISQFRAWINSGAPDN